jgi:hypothetical protein
MFCDLVDPTGIAARLDARNGCLSLAALALFAEQQLSSLPDHVAGPADSTTASVSPAPLASEVSQSNSDSRLTGVATIDSTAAPSASSEAPSTRGNIAPCEQPDAMGVSRVVEIDTTGGPEFGLQHLKGHHFLRDREVVLTFDDGPRPVSTVAVLKALEPP